MNPSRIKFEWYEEELLLVVRELCHGNLFTLGDGIGLGVQIQVHRSLLFRFGICSLGRMLKAQNVNGVWEVVVLLAWLGTRGATIKR